jgi:hypothetical protein
MDLVKDTGGIVIASYRAAPVASGLILPTPIRPLHLAFNVQLPHLIHSELLVRYLHLKVLTLFHIHLFSTVPGWRKSLAGRNLRATGMRLT